MVLRHGWTRFVFMQDQYSLLPREEAREMLGLLAHQACSPIKASAPFRGALSLPDA